MFQGSLYCRLGNARRSVVLMRPCKLHVQLLHLWHIWMITGWGHDWLAVLPSICNHINKTLRRAFLSTTPYGKARTRHGTWVLGAVTCALQACTMNRRWPWLRMCTVYWLLQNWFYRLCRFTVFLCFRLQQSRASVAVLQFEHAVVVPHAAGFRIHPAVVCGRLLRFCLRRGWLHEQDEVGALVMNCWITWWMVYFKMCRAKLFMNQWIGNNCLLFLTVFWC